MDNVKGLFRSLFLVSLLSIETHANFGGLCGCQPAQWKIKIDYSVDCPPVAPSSPGISQEDCTVFHLGSNNPSDLTFSGTVNVRILEVGPPENNEKTFPNLVNGQIITYESVLNEPDSVTEQTLPGSILVQINGFNAVGDILRVTWFYVFTNECDVFPVISGGEVQAATLVVSGCVARACENAQNDLSHSFLSVATSCATSSGVMPAVNPGSIKFTIGGTIDDSLFISIELSFHVTNVGTIDDSLFLSVKLSFHVTNVGTIDDSLVISVELSFHVTIDVAINDSLLDSIS